MDLTVNKIADFENYCDSVSLGFLEYILRDLALMISGSLGFKHVFLQLISRCW